MDARTLVRADALFEAGLGVVLLVCAATGVLGSSDFPRPVGPTVLLAVGALLVLLAGALWGGRIGTKALAIGNALTAGVAVAWLAAVSGFSAGGVAVVGAVVAGLALLAAAQAATLRA